MLSVSIFFISIAGKVSGGGGGGSVGKTVGWLVTVAVRILEVVVFTYLARFMLLIFIMYLVICNFLPRSVAYT